MIAYQFACDFYGSDSPKGPLLNLAISGA